MHGWISGQNPVIIPEKLLKSLSVIPLTNPAENHEEVAERFPDGISAEILETILGKIPNKFLNEFPKQLLEKLWSNCWEDSWKNEKKILRNKQQYQKVFLGAIPAENYVANNGENCGAFF